MAKKLKGQRIACLAADGFEQVELTIPRTALRLAGASVDVISIRRGKIRGMNIHLPGRKIRVDHTLPDVNEKVYDGLLIPGGFINPDFLRQSADARAFVRAFHEAGKPIATLCHGPWVLISSGLVEGRHMTSWPGLRDDVVNAGAIWHDAAVVRDRTWVTSRGPQDMLAFVPAMIDLFAGGEVEAPQGKRSDPQHATPPRWAVAPMAALTVPRVMAVAAVATGAVVAATGVAAALTGAAVMVGRSGGVRPAMREALTATRGALTATRGILARRFTVTAPAP